GKTALVEQEHRLCGVPKARRGKVFEETIHLLKKLWTEEEVTFRGEFYNLEGVRLGLRPRQRPHPPIWIAAGLFFTGQRGSGPFGDDEPAQEHRRGFIAPVDRVARLGDGWLTNQCTAEEFKANLEQIRELARKHGRDPSTITTAYNRGVFVDADVKRGFEEVKWFEYSYHAMPVPDETIHRWTIFGTGPECVRQIEPFVQAGVETFIICVRARDMFAQVRALAREVLPAFR
ncbi:MAG: LLM class flavin-dependent oxidoreductase, partial [Deltaproteobacteria bacterium]|nr:LLM class flavin-dependent oxidoreductase [Deltaproteobacteria bacterium]